MDEHVPDQNASDGKKIDPRQKNQGVEKGSWRAVLQASWMPALHVDRSKITAFQAIRGTLGVALPLIVGIVVLGEVNGGVVTASGALMLGSVGLSYPYRSRARAMLLTFLFVTLSALVGGITGSIGWLPIPLIGLWGAVAGLFASLSQTALIVGLQSCVAFIVYAHLKPDPYHALIIAGLIGLGAFFQTLLAIIPSPWKNTAPERTALASLYQDLADYAAHPSAEQGALQVSDVLFQGYTTLLDSDTRSARGQIFARLLAEAEHLRLTLSILNRQRHLLPAEESEHTNARISAYLAEIMRASAEELHLIAQALQPVLPFAASNIASVESSVTRSYAEVKHAVTELRHVARADNRHVEMQQILHHSTTLLGELRIVRKLASSWREVQPSWPAALRLPYPHAPRLYLEDLWSNLRANFSPQSAAFRHALRLGIALVLAMVISYVGPIPGGRGYWIPMTTVVVLRSDFITTFTRGTARLLGTLLGAVLTTLLAILLAPSPAFLLIIFLLAVYLMYATVLANYTIFSVMVTTATVFLLAFTKVPTLAIAAERAISTVIGGGLALLIYALWPTWESSQLPEAIARRLEKLSDYFDSVMQAYADPARAEKGVLGKCHMASRLARSNAQGSLQRARQEPRAHRAALDLADDLLSAADMLARTVITLEAYLLDHPHHDTLLAIANFSQIVEQAIQQLAEATRTKRPLTDPPDVRAALQELYTVTKARKCARIETQAQWHLVGEEARRIVKHIQAMQQLLMTNSFV